MTDFDLAVRLIAANGSTVRANLNDEANGLSVLRPFVYPEENERDTRVSAPRVDGTYQATSAADDAFMLVRVRVRGSSWGQVETRWEALRTAYRLESHYFLESELRGVKRRWRCERPNVTPEDIDGIALSNVWMTYQLRFRVQPNPTVTIA